MTASAAGGSAVEVTVADRIATLTMHVEPANALGDELTVGLLRALDEAESAGARVLVVRSSIPRYFAAGADLKLISGLDAARFRHYLEGLRNVNRTARRTAATVDRRDRRARTGRRPRAGDGLHGARGFAAGEARRAGDQARAVPRAGRDATPAAARGARPRPRHAAHRSQRVRRGGGAHRPRR